MRDRSVNGPSRESRAALSALLLAAGCATSGGAGQGFDGRVKQADEKLPAASRFHDDDERRQVEEAQERQFAARKAVEEGNLERARAEFAAAGERYARFVEAHPGTEWRIPFRFMAAEFHLFAQQPERAAEQAERVLSDAAANEASRAMAAHLSAVAWRAIAVQQIKAGTLPPVKLLTVEQRGGAPLAPRPPPEPWSRFLAAVDAFLATWRRHPEVGRPPAERNLALTPWHAALVAAEVEYANDRMPEARARLERLLDAWPGEVDVVENAVPLLLQAIAAQGDDGAWAAAVERVDALLERQAAKAGDARAKERFAGVREQVVRLARGRDFAAAKRLLDAGRAAEAGDGFERFAEAHPASPDAPNALYNAALAWDRAGAPEKAIAAREAILARYGDSRMAPMTTLQLAAAASRRGDHAAAAGRYAAYLERWPDAPDRCLALQNVGYELDVLGRKVEAAERYLAFGTEARCARERPDAAAQALYRAGKLFLEAQLRQRAKAPFEAAGRVEGVTDSKALRQVEDARRQAKRL